MEQPIVDISSGANRLQQLVTGKNVLYIATKNRDYLRVEQEILLLKKHANKLDIIVSGNHSYLFRLIYVFWNTLFYFRPFDMVFIGFAPQLILPLFKWKFKYKIIAVDFFISLYDTFIFDRKIFKKKSIASSILKKIDTITIKFSDLVICDTKEHAQYFINEFKAKPQSTIVLYLQADLKFFFPRNEQKPNKLKDKFIVLYFGSALPLQGIEVIIDMMGKIDNESIHFVLIGPLNANLKLKTLHNVTYINWLSQNDLSKHIAFSDLCLAGHFNNDIEKAKRVIPGKAYIYEIMQKKMILGDNKANRERYPQEYDNIFYVKMGDANELAKLILQIYNQWK